MSRCRSLQISFREHDKPLRLSQLNNNEGGSSSIIPSVIGQHIIT